MKNKSKKIIFAAIVILAILIAGTVYWRIKEITQGGPSSSALSDQIFKKANPVKDNIPDTNPFVNTETNPIKQIIKNPF
mgnify:CR=1 FL=1